MEILKATNLTKTFALNKKQRKEKKTNSKTFPAVDKINLSLCSGEIYGLLGPNGAGKTTTLRMLSTLLTPTSGEVEIDGVKLKKNADKFRSMIGFVTSELKLDGFFTPDYTFNFFASLYGLDDKFRDERKDLLFKEFGVEDFKYKKINELSTGMKQKVSLAISLIHDPKVIIFDEPTNGLDILASKIVEDYLLQLKKQGKAIIISTHIFSLVEKLCDRVGIIIDGKLIYQNDINSINKEDGIESVFFKLYEASKEAK